jgi:DNA repair protein RecO (recombination protein O)
MPSHDAEAIVLRHYALSEADRIVVLLTREVGLLRAVAHGARRPKSRIGACLQPLNHIRLEYYLKEGADLSRLFQCETIHSYLGRTPSLEQIYGFTYFAELIQELSVENNPSPVAFRLLLAALNAGESLGFTEALLRYFEIWLLKLNGFMPNYDYCSSCGRCVKELGFYVWSAHARRACAWLRNPPVH